MTNELMTYETSLGSVNLSADDVKKYLVKGNGNITDGEIKMFMAMCQAQKLNPFVTGEVHLIKYGSEAAQMVIGYDTYKRRADENPNFLYKVSGIVVQRGDEIVKKEGACIYPTETLIGGWCKVHRVRHEKEVIVYKEVSFSEYNKGKALWKEKPCTMIEKVAVSQALREAFPKDYEGLYTSEEIGEIVTPDPDDDNLIEPDEPVVIDPEITNQQRRELFAAARKRFGEEAANEKVKALLQDEGLESTSGMKNSTYERLLKKIADDREIIDAEIVEIES